MFTPEVKVYPLIDSPMMLCNQPGRLSRDYTDVKNWLLSWSPYKHLPWCNYFRFLNKPIPWKCPWTSSKKRTKNENTATSEQVKLGGKLKLRPSGIKLAKDRVNSWQRRCNDSTCSFWLACLFLSNWTCFSPTYQLKSFRPNLSVNKRKSSCHFAWRNGSIAAWMFVYSTNTAVIMDLKVFLISQKLFLSTSEYHHYYYHGGMWNMPDFWNHHNNSLSNVYQFIWSCYVFFYELVFTA